MAVITISRQMGSLGCQVAEEIGKCLGYRVVWREVINEAASRAGVPEVALATIDELDLLGLRPSQEDRQAYHHAVREIMKELAQAGNIVIVGRAGQVILKDFDHTVHVRIFAPMELRVERIASEYQISQDAAKTRIEMSDQARTRYLKRFYQSKWDDPDLYDVIVNTARVTPSAAAAMICQLVKETASVLH